MDKKSIFKSKTFWLNILGLAATVSGVLPPKYAMPVMAISNIGMRLITNQPVGLVGDGGK